MVDALIGHTGFVGTTLQRQRPFERRFRSTDIAEIEGGVSGDALLHFDNEADAQRRMSQETNERVGPFVQESMQRIDQMHAPLDTPAEYDRLQRSCSGS